MLLWSCERERERERKYRLGGLLFQSEKIYYCESRWFALSDAVTFPALPRSPVPLGPTHRDPSACRDQRPTLPAWYPKARTRTIRWARRKAECDWLRETREAFQTSIRSSSGSQPMPSCYYPWRWWVGRVRGGEGFFSWICSDATPLQRNTKNKTSHLCFYLKCAVCSYGSLLRSLPLQAAYTWVIR